MDCSKVGNLIYHLRREKGMTQRELAEKLNISGKTISKWERGLGCPDVSLLGDLSGALGVHIEKILQGDLSLNDEDRGNMKRLRFYVCQSCGNILTSTGDAEASCCGRKLTPLAAKAADGEHRLHVETVEEDYYITFSHEMSKQHYLSFIAAVGSDRVFFIRLYPEQGGEVRIPKMNDVKLYYYCSKHGFFVNQ